MLPGSFTHLALEQVLATVHQDGSCRLWDLATGTLLDIVNLPADLQLTSTFGRAVFMEGVFGQPTLVAAVKAGKQGRILTWEQDAMGELKLKSNVKTRTSPITAMSVSRDGAIVGCASADGEIPSISSMIGTWGLCCTPHTVILPVSLDFTACRRDRSPRILLAEYRQKCRKYKLQKKLVEV